MMVRNYKRKTQDRWSKEDLVKALTLISEKKLKINEAARQFGISRATLYRHNRKVIDGEESLEDIVSFVRQKGGLSLLNGLEENVLEKTVFDLIKQGFTVSATDVKKICFEYCNTNGIPNKFNKERRIASDDWYYGFLKRHPILTVSPSSEDEEASSDDTKTDTASPDSIKQPKGKGYNLTWNRKRKNMSNANAKKKADQETGPKRRKKMDDPANRTSGRKQTVNDGNEVEIKEEPSKTDATDAMASMDEDDPQPQKVDEGDIKTDSAEGEEQLNSEFSEQIADQTGKAVEDSCEEKEDSEIGVAGIDEDEHEMAE